MREADRGVRFALAVPTEALIRIGKPDLVVYAAFDNDNEMFEIVEERIAEDAVEAGVGVEIKRLTKSGSKFRFSSKRWGVSWEPEGPTTPWEPGNDPNLS